MNSLGSDGHIATQPMGPDTMGDARLVAEVRSRTSSAFAALSQRHSQRILHWIYRITNNWQDAEDVLQKSLIQAFMRLDAFECRTSFSTLFTSIATNSALMPLRKENRFMRLDLGGVGLQQQAFVKLNLPIIFISGPCDSEDILRVTKAWAIELWPQQRVQIPQIEIEELHG